MRWLLLLLYLNIYSVGNSQPREEIKARIDSLVSYVKNKATESFTEHTAYRGEDVNRKWKDVYNPAVPEELQAGKAIMEEFKKAIADCRFKEFDTFKEDKQSEGTWYVYTYACGSEKKIHLAFLKIGDRYVLGDIDVVDEED